MELFTLYDWWLAKNFQLLFDLLYFRNQQFIYTDKPISGEQFYKDWQKLKS